MASCACLATFWEAYSLSINGGDDNDRIIGGLGNDSIRGGLGDDRIDGGDGNDTIFGDLGNDNIIGGEGNGGVIYPQLHYGRDALAGIALFLTHLAKSNVSAKKLRSCYPSYHISKNKIELTPEIDLNEVLSQIEKNMPINPSILSME